MDMAYSIGEFARLSGITATTLRAWQRRYGLLKPQRTEGGHRQYSDEDVQQALKILDWVKKACPLAVKPRLSALYPAGPTTGKRYSRTCWNACRGKIESLRQMIYDAGREYPRPELVTNVLRPLRSRVRQRRRRHDPARDPRRHPHRLHLVLPRRR